MNSQLNSENHPLIAIVGETASGKTALAIELAKQFNGEIICADSRTVYKELDISTAKPSPLEREQVPHHLIDVAVTDETFTVAGFKRLAQEAVEAIRAKGKIPLIVGGSGLYVDALVYDFQFQPAANSAERQRLMRLSVEGLQQELTQKGISLPENSKNPRYLIRALETGGRINRKASLGPRTLIIGLRLEREELERRIEQRIDQMIGQGLVEEIKRVSDRYGWDLESLQTPAFKALRPYLIGEISLEEAKQRFMRQDKLLAKRQRTWFKRNPDINWIERPEQAFDLIKKHLHKIQ